MKITSPSTRICAMCSHWNGPVGGKNVRPKTGMRSFFEYDPEERNICYENHFSKAAWNSCNQWKKKF